MKFFILLSCLVICSSGDQFREGNDKEVLDQDILTTLGPMIIRTTSKPSINTDTKTEKIGTNRKVDVRLPTSLKPLHYVVKLQPFISGNFSIDGYVEIEMEVLEPASNITLHISDIITHNDTVKLRPSDNLMSLPLSIIRHEYDHERQFYITHLEEPLEQGKKYVLSMHFTGYLNNNLRGFYRSTYRDADGSEKLLAVTQFQATDARKAFPCFDEPAMKATFEVSLARETHMSSISNMPVREITPVFRLGQGNWQWDHYETSVPMSTYLLAFIISDFDHSSSTAPNNSTLFRVWTRKAAIDQAEYARRVGPAILAHFEDYFNMVYPLPKQDMIALPDFSAGAMENWGLITYRETAMLYDPKVSAASNKKAVAATVSHELAHQWFGNIVTPKWWTDLWLNEGFATYVQYIGVDHVEPTWNIMDLMVTEKLHNVLGLDSLETSHPISISVRHPDEISEIFDTISYSKGASIIRMMNHFLTEKSFRKGLTNYLHAFKYDSAEQDDLWHHLTVAAHGDRTLPEDLTVKTIMDTWTLQMGYPLIKVIRSANGTSASVSQERFLMTKSENPTDDHDYKWWIPLNYASSSDPNFKNTNTLVWMRSNESEITLPSLPPSNEWVIFNIQETGFYRVNYDENNWKLIIQQLQTDHKVIDNVNRAQIVDDVMDLARAGHLDYTTALSVYGYLGKETDYVPWSAASSNLAYIEQMFSRSGGFGSLKTYLLELILPLYKSVGIKDTLDDPLLEQLKRQTAISWACELGYKDCLNEVQRLFRNWMQNPSDDSVISPNLKSTVYCRAIAEGGEEEWNFAWDQYLNSNVAAAKSTILLALGCTKEVWLLSRYLEMAITPNSGVRKQDFSLVFASVARNKVGSSLAWEFLKDKWFTIKEYLGRANPSIIKLSTRSFNTVQQLKELELFKEENAGRLGAAARATEQAIQGTKINIAWMNTNHNTIIEWLDQNGYYTKLKNA